MPGTRPARPRRRRSRRRCARRDPGFKPTSVVNGKAVCGSTHENIAFVPLNDYFNGEDDPFQYYPSTNNEHHVAPSSPAMIGHSDQANHQYDLSDFWTAADSGNLPGVSFLRAPSYQQGHPGYSDPLDEQHFLVDTLNRLQRLPSWRSAAVVITWDESDGWYDHVMPPIVNPSNDQVHDVLAGPGMCGTPKPGAYLDRCGYGPRIPVLALSPYTRTNFVDHEATAQSAIIRFVEDNWQLGRIGDQSFDARSGTLNAMFDFSHPHRAALILDPVSGQPH
jgi:phospholipase C